MGIFNPKLPPKPALKKSVIQVRKGEKAKSWFRGERFLQSNGQWYFTIREGRDVGPFNSRQSAEHGLALFIEQIVDRGVALDHAITVAKNGDWAVDYYQ